MKKGVLVLGATSGIAKASAQAFAKRGYPIFLAGRDVEELERIKEDTALRFNVPVATGVFDVCAFDNHEDFIQTVVKQLNGLDGVVLAVGNMGSPEKLPKDPGEVRRVVDANFTGACSVLTYCANYLERQESGFIVGISSVAGDRGRQSNYVYGSAKSGLTAFLQGLRNRLYPSGVHVMTVKPGFVDTAMTFGLPGLFLVANPQDVGEKLAASAEKGKDEVYIPGFWRYIMAIIKSIPERLFKTLKL
jgi:short-subunit dehydrogenase